MANDSNRFPLQNAIKKILDDPNSRPELPGLKPEPTFPREWIGVFPDKWSESVQVFSSKSLQGTGTEKLNDNLKIKSLQDVGDVGTEEANDKLKIGISGSPAVAVFNNKLYCVYEGPNNDGSLHYCTFDGQKWYDDQTIGKNRTSGPPALAVFNNKLYCVHEGAQEDGWLYYCHTSDGQNWSSSDKLDKDGRGIGTSLRARRYPTATLAVYKGLLYCVHEGQGSKDGKGWLWYCTFNGEKWSGEDKLPNHGTTGAGSLAVVNETLICFHEGKDGSGVMRDTFFDDRWNTSKWSEDEEFKLVDNENNKVSYNTSGPPAVVTDGKQIYFAHEGSGNDGFVWSFNNKDRQDKILTIDEPALQRPIRTSGPPAIAIYNNNFYILHQGPGDDGQLWVTTTSVVPNPKFTSSSNYLSNLNLLADNLIFDYHLSAKPYYQWWALYHGGMLSPDKYKSHEKWDWVSNNNKTELSGTISFDYDFKPGDTYTLALFKDQSQNAYDLTDYFQFIVPQKTANLSNLKSLLRNLSFDYHLSAEPYYQWWALYHGGMPSPDKYKSYKKWDWVSNNNKTELSGTISFDYDFKPGETYTLALFNDQSRNAYDLADYISFTPNSVVKPEIEDRGTATFCENTGLIESSDRKLEKRNPGDGGGTPDRCFPIHLLYFYLCWFFGAPHERRLNNTDYGGVTIGLEDPPTTSGSNIGRRPVLIEGVVMPVPVGRRDQTPQPIAGWSDRWNGRDIDRGHLFALNLGGPDVPENIVPQWAHWQRLDDWRAMERTVNARAVQAIDGSRPFGGGSPQRSVFLSVRVIYPRTNQPSLRSWAFPSRFVVTAYVCDRQTGREIREQGVERIYDNEEFEGYPDNWNPG
ncbi:DNA/RNA non-specific endonuclease [Tolypothrix sp. VBCCA 56010]|uniref:DNA/RNA non-specific endonuclease n=1 Tax=Tolypothrix sp. VBCCA 56010 TaxID=3137731 RepID=UPI003D7E7EC6